MLRSDVVAAVSEGKFRVFAVETIDQGIELLTGVAADASVIMPFNFLKLPFAVVIGMIWFTEQPDLLTVVGAAIIFSSTWYIARREAGKNAA